jgi:hypothetical protein
MGEQRPSFGCKLVIWMTYSKPVQVIAHSGPGEGPIETAEITLTPMERAAGWRLFCSDKEASSGIKIRRTSQTELADLPCSTNEWTSETVDRRGQQSV